jgi:hypothetical protein
MGGLHEPASSLGLFVLCVVTKRLAAKDNIGINRVIGQKGSSLLSESRVLFWVLGHPDQHDWSMSLLS